MQSCRGLAKFGDYRREFETRGVEDRRGTVFAIILGTQSSRGPYRQEALAALDVMLTAAVMTLPFSYRGLNRNMKQYISGLGHIIFHQGPRGFGHGLNRRSHRAPPW